MQENSIPQYKNVILARMGEIALKGLNRGKFENNLIQNIRTALSPIGRFSIFQNQSRLWIEDSDFGNPMLNDVEIANEVLLKTSNVIGLVSASLVRKFSGEMEDVYSMSIHYVSELLASNAFASFKIESKRGDKQFPYGSPEICAKVGSVIAENFPDLKVDVHTPDFILYIEIRDFIYMYSSKTEGHRGLPVGSSGKGLLMLSGGIDSPVAGYMMMTRGMTIDAIYYHSFPYTSDRAKEKVIHLAKILTGFGGKINLHIVNFTDIQLELYKNSPHDMLTVTMRRIMIRIAQIVALKYDCQVLITGDSLGQVASQTLEALVLSDEVSDIPTFRPLVGLDKEFTTQIARRIGTFETSILPYEDCCTVFVAKHPQTHPRKRHIEQAEKDLDITALVEKGVNSIETVILDMSEEKHADR